jgi:hypothetical protein
MLHFLKLPHDSPPRDNPAAVTRIRLARLPGKLASQPIISALRYDFVLIPELPSGGQPESRFPASQFSCQSITFSQPTKIPITL